MPPAAPPTNSRCPNRWTLLLVALLNAALGGCWAPLRSYGVPASQLPDSFRAPQRIVGPTLNYANLVVPPPTDYRLGPNDLLEVSIGGLAANADAGRGTVPNAPLVVRVMANGDIHLPQIGALNVLNKNLAEAQQAITQAYLDGFLVNPRVSVSLSKESTVDVLVMGEVKQPGIKQLPKYQHDVGHALAAASGLTELAGDVIEVHRRVGALERIPQRPPTFDEYDRDQDDPKKILRIPLRGVAGELVHPTDVTLAPGDVVIVPSRRAEVFWVVGKLSQTNSVRFQVDDRARELGTGLVLPREREIDVVTAVAMAGYFDPIDSPTTVTVHRHFDNGEQVMILVDLIEARYNPRATVLVRAGDIIYLNPDSAWYFRRTFDRIVPDLITAPYREAMFRWIVR